MKKKILQLMAKFVTDPDFRFLVMGKYGFLKSMDDEEYIKKLYRINMGKELDLTNPKTFNEKLQWLKLYNRKPIYTTMVDKYAVKEYVANIIGEKYIIPTLGVWNRVEDINFDLLPNQFVLKCTHDSHGLVICRDKSALNIKEAKQKLKKALKRNYYYQFREWSYKNVTPRIIAEQYMEDNATSELRDYKVLCFNGEPKIIEIHSNRFSTAHTQDFYDITWKPLPIRQGTISPKPIECPLNLDKMIEFSRVLSNNMIHIRVDWYEVNGRLYFGEMTFYDGSGFEKFEPIEWDYKLGQMIQLPEKTEKSVKN